MCSGNFSFKYDSQVSIKQDDQRNEQDRNASGYRRKNLSKHYQEPKFNLNQRRSLLIKWCKENMIDHFRQRTFVILRADTKAR